MPIGSYQHVVTLDIPNGSNGYLPLNPPDWYCDIRDEGLGQTTLTGHYHAGITTATRVHFKGRTYHVASLVNRGERDRELVLSCAEVFD